MASVISTAHIVSAIKILISYQHTVGLTLGVPKGMNTLFVIGRLSFVVRVYIQKLRGLSSWRFHCKIPHLIEIGTHFGFGTQLEVVVR